MINEQKELIIIGMTEAGVIFEVPDWPERLCEMVASLWSNEQANHSEYLHPAHIDGFPALVIQGNLKQDDPAAYSVVKKFVAENHLKTRYGRDAVTGMYPAYPHERRQYFRG